MNAPRLTRELFGTAAAPPVRIVHLGLGNFHRAHQAWHTHRAPDAGEWGIAAFTGRRPDMARALAPQDGLFTLITRDSDGDTFEVIDSIVAVHAADEHRAFVDYLARPEVAIVTMTVTEHGYLRDGEGGLDRERPEVAADVEALRAGGAPQTLPGRLYAGLHARHAAGSGPITILSCDNLPDNGEVTKRIVTDLAAELDADLIGWIEDNVDFATSMVDRITPATTPEDVDLVERRQGYSDVSPVPTEPFSEWVISGEFPAGRPAWEQAGVQLVDDVAPHERRKLWLLNGSHSLMAYVGSVQGRVTIDEAIADEALLQRVQDYWEEAQRHLGLDSTEVAAYRGSLLARYRNTGVRHLLAQIVSDGSQKIPVRIVPVVRAERAAGNLPLGALSALAGWVLHLRGHGAPVKDPGAGPAQDAAGAADLGQAVEAVLRTIATDLADDTDVVGAVTSLAEELLALPAHVGG